MKTVGTHGPFRVPGTAAPGSGTEPTGGDGALTIAPSARGAPGARGRAAVPMPESAVLTSGLSLLGELAYSRATADPHPCQTALAGGASPKGGPQQLKEETGRFFERLLK